ncbi:LSU ribosomal protein L23P [Nitrosomonas cryotolerans]|uniref:Large ribosomal subunit protein uL23 n=1 Tax=Nitrosomonas cryotolerans ATCC 49181 TaxID=1131553 RepID=A0A1N6HIW8_9PROT|nr:50S ribosomal protein L23 [Nitrosomonas cryotolerans]SFP65107.1 LSU ribosomal protein L23P [Nitrosomonas cryotolerans]SIO19814.1 LSU ribosomal protein L23P [Nitrosomonas cryotolerans ATCC 49181]
MKNAINNQERLLQIILAPQISEKATHIGEKNKQSVFRVAHDATKIEIKAAIELLWKEQKINVDSVQVLNVKGKKKRFGRHMGQRSGWKKAFVSLKDGKEINYTEFSTGEDK